MFSISTSNLKGQARSLQNLFANISSEHLLCISKYFLWIHKINLCRSYSTLKK
jgi:hypothetical protein